MQQDSPIDETYLPFTPAQLRTHFVRAPGQDNSERQMAYYLSSAGRYRDFVATHPDRRGIPLSEARGPAQVEKDERFWLVSALMHAEERGALPQIMDACVTPPADTAWHELLGECPDLCFEVSLSAPAEYRRRLRDEVDHRQPVAYARNAARKPASDEIRANLEGATHLDALVLNPSNGVNVVFEAKVLSDVSAHVSFDALRNQLARNIDVMLEPPTAAAHPPLNRRDPSRSYFVLVTPELFRKRPESRLYGHLLPEYMRSAEALHRDLPHRTLDELSSIPQRLGWLTFEEIERTVPGSCRWLPAPPAVDRS